MLSVFKNKFQVFDEIDKKLLPVVNEKLPDCRIADDLIDFSNHLQSCLLFELPLFEMERNEASHHFCYLRVELLLQYFFKETAVVLDDHVPHPVVVKIQIDDVQGLSQIFRNLLASLLRKSLVSNC